MIRLVQTPRTAFAHVIIFISVIAAFALVASLFSTGALQAQSVASKSNAANVANDPDVLGAERLFSAWIEGQMAYRGLPGVAVGVVSDQELVWAKGFGFADVKAKLPMAASTKFRMASHSKLFTAIAIMQLREEGKLGLDDPVVKYLPWFKAKPAGDDDGPITVEQLLSHSSGLQREAGDHWTTLVFPTSNELQRLYADRQAAFAPVGAVEVFQPRLFHCRHAHREGKRAAVGRLR
jgi:D-alanyl-D-alanine carboxypeptidase